MKCLHIPPAKGMETIQCDLSDQSNLTQTAAAQALMLAAVSLWQKKRADASDDCFCCELVSWLFLLMTQKLEKAQPASKGPM